MRQPFSNSNTWGLLLLCFCIVFEVYWGGTRGAPLSPGCISGQRPKFFIRVSPTDRPTVVSLCKHFISFMTFVRFYCTSSFGLFWRGISCSLSAISINEIYFGSFLLLLRLVLAVKRLIWLGRVYRVSSCFVFRTCHVFGNCRIFLCLQNVPRFWDLSFFPDVSRTCHVCNLFKSDIHTLVIFLRHCTMLGPS